MVEFRENVLQLTKGQSDLFDAIVRLYYDKPCPKTKRARVRDMFSHQRKFTTERLIESDGNVCRWCGEAFDNGPDRNHPKTKSLDHFVPSYYGGPKTLYNFVLAHRECNQKKTT